MTASDAGHLFEADTTAVYRSQDNCLACTSTSSRRNNLTSPFPMIAASGCIRVDDERVGTICTVHFAQL